MSAHHDELRIRRSDEATRARIRHIVNKNTERTADAELIAACQETARLADLVYSGQERPEEEMDELIEAMYRYVYEIIDIPARSPEAKRAKGIAAFKVFAGVEEDFLQAEWLALAALRDLLGEAVA